MRQTACLVIISPYNVFTIAVLSQGQSIFNLIMLSINQFKDSILSAVDITQLIACLEMLHAFSPSAHFLPKDWTLYSNILHRTPTCFLILLYYYFW